MDGGEALVRDNRVVKVFLETERLRLRRLEHDDVEHLVELDSDPQVMRFINGGRATTRCEIENEVLPAFLGHYERYAGSSRTTSSTSSSSTAIRR